MSNKICLLYNFAQHYRIGIFRLIDRNLDCDMYFGDKLGDIKKLDYKELKNFKKEYRNVKLISKIYYQQGSVWIAFKKYRDYIILGEYLCLSTWVILILCRLFGKRTHIWTHGWYGSEGSLKKWVKKLFFSIPNSIFLYGEYAKKLMIEEGIASKKLFVVYNSLDYDEQLKIRLGASRTKGFNKFFSNSDPTIVFIGRITPEKKLEQVLEAQYSLLSKGVKFNTVIVGAGPSLDELKIIAQKYNISERVWFYGPCYDEDEIANLVFNSHVCVSPGNVGLTAIHSLNYGTPVITHSKFSAQGPEFEAIQDGITGSFFEYQNISSLSEKIEKWISMDMEKRENVRLECYKIVDQYYNPNYQLEVIKTALNAGSN